MLPSIRKHGIYATDNVIDNILNNPDFGIELLTKLKEERAARVEAERKNAILMHKYQVNGTWVMYSKYSDLGYEQIKQEVLDSDRVIYHRRITQMGREFILELFSNKVE